MDSLASLASSHPDHADPHDSQCITTYAEPQIPRNMQIPQPAADAVAVLCVAQRGEGGTQFWFSSALKRWLRGAVIDMWASSARRQLWLVEPAVNHPLPLVPLSADSGLWRSSLSLVCMVTSHRVCKRQCALWIRFNFFFIKILLS